MERIFSIIYVIDAEEWKTEQQEFLKGVLEGGTAEVFLYDITGNNENKTVIKNWRISIKTAYSAEQERAETFGNAIMRERGSAVASM